MGLYSYEVFEYIMIDNAEINAIYVFNIGYGYVGYYEKAQI